MSDDSGVTFDVGLGAEGVQASGRVSHRALDTFAKARGFDARARTDAELADRIAAMLRGERAFDSIDALTLVRLYRKELKAIGNADAATRRAFEFIASGTLPVTAKPLPGASPQDQQPATSDDVDWHQRWLGDVEDISHEGLQDIYARLLAGQLNRPGRYSRKTLSVLRDLDPATATLFSDIATFEFANAWVPAWSWLCAAAENRILPRDVYRRDWRRGDLQVLRDAGLVSPESGGHTYFDFAREDGGNCSCWMQVRGELYKFVVDDFPGRQIAVEREPLTQAGRELATVVANPPQAPHAAIPYLALMFRSGHGGKVPHCRVYHATDGDVTALRHVQGVDL